MTARALAAACCCGLMLAAAIAWRIGSDLSTSGFMGDHFDGLVGGSGIAALVLALLASLRRSWARVPLAAAGLVAALMAYVRLSPPDPMGNPIDLTPLILPPIIFLFGAVALMMTFMSHEPDQSPT